MTMDPARAARMAKHRNRNAAQREPLFAEAGLLPQVTPEDVVAQHDEFDRRNAERTEQAWRRLAELRALMVAEVGEETVAEWDAYSRRVYPLATEYIAGYYNKRYRERRGCTVYCIDCAEACPLHIEIPRNPELDKLERWKHG